MIDQFGRDINYLRLSVTDKCNLRCLYCIPEFSKEVVNESKLLTIDEYFRLTRILSMLGVKKVRITGGEPLVRKGIPELVKKINTLENIEEIAMTTNGILLEKYLDELFENGLTSLNISLDTLDEKKYDYITRGGDLNSVINSINKALEYKMKIKINAVIINDFNKDEIKNLVEFSEEKGIDLRFIELMPIGCGKSLEGVSNEKVLEIISKDKNIQKTETNNFMSGPADYYFIPETKTKIGFISPLSSCFCKTCNRIRITSEGKLKQCLYYESKSDLMKKLRSGISDNDLFEIIKNEIYFKNEKHNFLNEADNTENNKEEKIMSAIGG